MHDFIIQKSIVLKVLKVEDIKGHTAHHKDRSCKVRSPAKPIPNTPRFLFRSPGRPRGHKRGSLLEITGGYLERYSHTAKAS